MIQDVKKIKAALKGNNTDLVKLLDEYHSSELALILGQLSQEAREQIINLLPVETASEIISEMELESHPERLFENLNEQLVNDIIEELDIDDATDIIAQLSDEKREKILKGISIEDATSIRKLLSYPADSAGGIMNSEMIRLHYSLTKKEAIEEIIRQSEEMEEFYTIYVVDNSNRLLGSVSLKNIIKAKQNSVLENLMETNLITVSPETDQEEVASLLSQYNLTGIPVIDKNEILIGRVTFDDIIDVMQEETTEDILKIAGVSDTEELTGNWKEAVKSRLPWLIVNLGTAFLAGFVVLSFSSTIKSLTILAAFMPIVAGLGGNAGTQALAVTIRRISLSSLPDATFFNTVLKEFLVGLFNGVVVGIIACVVAIITHQTLLFGLVVFMAMTGNLIIAGIAGASVPIILVKLGFDPAVASSIFITTFTDTLGFTLLLGIGSWLLL